MAGGAWFAHFRAPVLISPFQNHLRNGLRSSDRDVGRNEAGRHRSVDDHACSRLVSSGARLNQSCKTIPNREL